MERKRKPESLAGRRGAVNLPELHSMFVAHKEFCRAHGLSEVFEPCRVAPRPEWHGKKCTVLAINGGVVRIDGVQTLYELLPMKNVVLDDDDGAD